MREKILNALKSKYMGIIAEAEANIEVYLENPVGIGEHPDIIAAIDIQMTILAEAEDKLHALEIF
tara:strand:- start:867 stop:1061 length:195 start_codon:yes stop_codon:yes gene_type:complete